jgi:hypothetical protein
MPGEMRPQDSLTNWAERLNSAHRTCNRRLETDIEQLPQKQVGAPDAAVDMPLPEFGNAGGRNQKRPAALHFDNIDPLNIRVVIGPCAVGQRRDIMKDIARLGDVLHLVLKTVQIAEDVAKQAAPDFVVQFIGGHLGFACSQCHCARGQHDEEKTFYWLAPLALKSLAEK